MDMILRKTNGDIDVRNLIHFRLNDGDKKTNEEDLERNES